LKTRISKNYNLEKYKKVFILSESGPKTKMPRKATKKKTPKKPTTSALHRAMIVAKHKYEEAAGLRKVVKKNGIKISKKVAKIDPKTGKIKNIVRKGPKTILAKAMENARKKYHKDDIRNNKGDWLKLVKAEMKKIKQNRKGFQEELEENM
jgi:hypothetical protein